MTLPPPERLNVSEYFLGDRIAEGHEGRRALLTDAGPVEKPITLAPPATIPVTDTGS